MDYFQLLNLKKEPFSTSPDPDFFFQSRQHLACLQKLEISIRLRRGLNVVIGDVGTGKTTLSRQLIRQFTDDPDTTIFLIFDPFFKTPADALKAVMKLFNPSGEDVNDDHEIKEALKQHLFAQGVGGEKKLVMIIDEGQKMPAFFVEILRELLNYETNQHKLLQIIIFAQKEFATLLKQFPNFADRIALYHPLNPLKFAEMRQMIRFRLSAAGAVNSEKHFFTFPALWNIYIKTGGYPRKIIHICHQAFLTMIVHGRPRVNYRIVSLCARQLLFPEAQKARQSGRFLVIILGICIAIALGSGKIASQSFLQQLSSFTSFNTKTPVIEKNGINTEQPIADPPVHDPALTHLGTIYVQAGETLGKIIHSIYGIMDKQLVEQVVQANPNIISPHRISVGQAVLCPAIRIYSSCPPGKLFIEISSENELKTAYQYFRKHHERPNSLRLIAWQTDGSKMTYSVVLEKTFMEKQEAETVLNELGLLFPNALIRSSWPNNAVFYSVLCNREYSVHIKGKNSEKTHR